MTDEIKHSFTKDTIICKYRNALINQKEVRAIDNLIYWTIVMPPADYIYEILKEHTKDNEYMMKKGTKDDGEHDYLSDDMYLGSKNIATCIAVDYVKTNEKYFTEDNDNYASGNSDEDDAFSVDTPIGGKMYLKDYANIALKARFSFTERKFICAHIIKVTNIILICTTFNSQNIGAHLRKTNS